MGGELLRGMITSRYIEKCPVGCGSDLKPTDILLPEGPLLRCGDCGQLVSQITEEAYVSSMRGFNVPEGTLPQGKFEDRPPRLHRKRLNEISRLTGLSPREARLLDVGCSSGSFLSSAKKMGYRETGVEPAVEPVKTATKQGLNVFQGILQDLNFPDDHYDVITLFEVIEHLRDPLSLLEESRRILKTGGIMVIGTGNTDSWTVRFMRHNWDYFDMSHGGHISFFNPASLSKLSVKAGFKVMKIETRSVSFYRKDQVSQFRYGASKIVREVLGMPAKLLNKGHDLLVFLKK